MALSSSCWWGCAKPLSGNTQRAVPFTKCQKQSQSYCQHDLSQHNPFAIEGTRQTATAIFCWQLLRSFVPAARRTSIVLPSSPVLASNIVSVRVVQQMGWGGQHNKTCQNNNFVLAQWERSTMNGDRTTDRSVPQHTPEHTENVRVPTANVNMLVVRFCWILTNNTNDK